MCNGTSGNLDLALSLGIFAFALRTPRNDGEQLRFGV
jgi:hypothetical protein